MANLVASAAGAAVGFFLGGPTGASIGWAAGGMIYAASQTQEVQGPRLTNLAAPEIQYGAKIPRVHGRVWRTAIPVWWSGLRETRIRESQGGGKGGPEIETTTYAYSADVLYLLADGDNVIDWTRIEYDGEVVQSRLADSSAETLSSELWQDYYDAVEIFTGGATQMPWSVMEAVVGVDNAIAYRDQCTIGFTNLQFRGKSVPPTLRVEIVTVAEPGLGNVFWLSNANGTVGSTSFPDTSSWNQVSTGINMQQTADAAFGSTGGTNTTLGTSYNFGYEFSSATVPWTPDEHLTLEARLKVDVDLQANYELVSLNNIVVFQVIDTFSPDNKYLELVLFNQAVQIGPFDGYPLPLLSWFHAAVDYDGDTRTATAYINGDQVLQITYSGTPPAITSIGSGHAGYAAAGAHAAGVGSVDAVRFTRRLRRYPGPFTPPNVEPTADDSVAPGVADLQTILESEFGRAAPLTAGDLDFSAAAGKEVRGVELYGSAAQCCGPLLDWHFLELFCLDRITCVERGGASEATIPFAWTGAGNPERSDPFAGLKRENSLEKPAVMVVQYVNQLADGETGTEDGAAITPGVKVSTVNCNIYALPTEAKGRAQSFTRDARVAGHTATVRLGTRHGARRQPGSVVTLVDNKGLQYRTRIPRLVWNRGVYECEVVLDDTTVLQPIGVTSEDYTPSIEVAVPSVAEWLALDNPPVPGADTAGYLALVKTETAASARWYQDDVATGPILSNDAVFGTVTAVVGTPRADGFFDEASSLTVNVGDGTLSSSTRAALLASRGEKLFIVGIDGRLVLGQYRTATQTAPGVYVLTGLLLGQRGTEQYAADITAGDSFALLGTSGTAHITRTAAQLGVELAVKAVVVGRSVGAVTAEAFTPNGESVTPRSPVQLRRVADASTGDSTYTFNRRTRGDTRFGGPLGDSCPLGEDSEQYHVRFYTDGTYTTVVRDLGVITAPTFAYSGAHRTSDYGSTTATAFIGITQISALVGEGHALQAAA